LHQLQRHLAREQTIDTLGEPDASHPAVPEQSQHAIGTEPLAGHPRIRISDRAIQHRIDAA